MKQYILRWQEYQKKNKMVRQWLGRDTSDSKYEMRLNNNLIKSVNIVSVIVLIIILFFHEPVKQIVLSWCSFRHFDSGEMIKQFQDNKDFVGSAVWTLTTFLPPFLTLYYSILGSRHYGLTNRKIIAYTVGTLFIPIMVGYNAIVVALMTWMYYADSCTNFYLTAIYSCFLQACLICVCLLSTSRFAASHSILYVEAKQIKDLSDRCLYHQPIVDRAESEKQYNRRRKNLENAMGGVVFHLDSVLRWEEPFSEKKRMILDILLLPFEQFLDEALITDYALYNYTYRNFGLVVDYAKKVQKNEGKAQDRSDVQNIFDLVIECFIRLNELHEGHAMAYRKRAEHYDMEADRFAKQASNSGQDSCSMRENADYFRKESENLSMTAERLQERDALYFGAFISAFVPAWELEKRWELVRYILDEVITDGIFREVLISELILCIQFNLSSEKLDSSNTDDINEMEACIRELYDFEKVIPKTAILFERLGNFSDEDMRLYHNMILFWLDGTSYDRMSQYDLVYEVCNSLSVNDNHDIIDYFLNLTRRVYAV